MITDECGLDICGFVFVFHVVESHQNRLLQCLFVVGYKNVINALLFLLKGSASVFTLRVVEGVLHGLLQAVTVRRDSRGARLRGPKRSGRHT